MFLLDSQNKDSDFYLIVIRPIAPKPIKTTYRSSMEFSYFYEVSISLGN